MKVGLIGLGRMGRAMAERLEETGAELLVWNRSADKAGGLAAEVAESPAAVAAGRDVVLSIMANDAALEAVYFGTGGLCSAPLGGTTIVEMTTTAPDTIRRLEAAVREAGGRLVECPVGGTIAPARAGKLLGLAGGEADDLERVMPVMQQLVRRIEHVGPVGAGAAMKLSINLPLMVYWAALGEALGLAIGSGIDPELALDILADSSGAIGAAKMRVPPILEMLRTGEPGGVNFALEVALKDMGLMEEACAATGRPGTVIAATRAKAAAAAREGFGPLDASMVGLCGLVDPNRKETK
ncbi:NAD(P)-dependent oxidoreductase [Histidinibacterium lentulum]|uniref:NAD(P)-dependent oxidoreductase n=1 Tax=Histidinibacterium lentulum TaxID=2480588 RepID=A0A3N2RA07_9RHOB|nr:NAD(P)-dependent oxidoreductase [Histidinibacterium lentulum]ROU04245.1 NAD(P)-dependent oxidoreductase [Histidinibacterium lentulum]